MRRQTYEQIRVISCKGHRWGEFEKDVNRAMQQLSGGEPTLQIDLTEGIALIRYRAELDILENAKDKMTAVGTRYECRNCPLCERPRDGRYKYTKCEKSPYVRWRGEACDEFYEMVQNGEITPLMDEEDFRL